MPVSGEVMGEKKTERRGRGPDADGGWGWRGRGADGACAVTPNQAWGRRHCEAACIDEKAGGSGGKGIDSEDGE